MKKAGKGFTLIELLVVIAIIGILSATVLVSLNTARQKARVTAIKAGVVEFKKLMELEYSNTGSYANLNKGWIGSSPNTSCAGIGYAGTYASQAVAICNSIHANISNKGTNDFFTGVSWNAGYNTNDHYSIMARMPDGTLWCAGSSGAVGPGTGGNNYIDPGCWGNP